MSNVAFFPLTYRPTIIFKNKIAQLLLSVTQCLRYFFLSKDKKVKYKRN